MTAQARVNQLTQSMDSPIHGLRPSAQPAAVQYRSRRYCQGELVPQDSNDEPASELLARIKAQRAAAPKTKRGRKQVPST